MKCGTYQSVSFYLFVFLLPKECVGAFAIIARLISREEMGIVAVVVLISAAAQPLTGLGVVDSLNSLALFASPMALQHWFRDQESLQVLSTFVRGDVAGYAWTWFDRALLLPLVTLSLLSWEKLERPRA
jgi:hypothetical protein